MSHENDNPESVEIKLCNVVYTLKGKGLFMTLSGICATIIKPDGTRVEAVFADGFTHDEIVRGVFRNIGMSSVPSFKVQRAPRKIVTHYIEPPEKH